MDKIKNEVDLGFYFTIFNRKQQKVFKCLSTLPQRQDSEELVPDYFVLTSHIMLK